jgi:hypothetical protein
MLAIVAFALAVADPWLSSMNGIKRAWWEIAVVFATLDAIRQTHRPRSMPPAVVLCTNVVGLPLLIFKDRLGIQLDIAIATMIAVGWIGAVIAAIPALRNSCADIRSRIPVKRKRGTNDAASPA